MKSKQDKKQFHFVRLLVTLFISAAIIGLGFLFINSIRYWIPTYKNDITYMGEDSVEMQPLYWKREEAITIYPWGLYQDNTAVKLDDKDKELLQQAQIPTLLSEAVSCAQPPDFTEHFQKVTVNNTAVYFLKDYVCSGYQTPANTMGEHQVHTKSDAKNLKTQNKIVNCAVDQNGQLLYLHVVDQSSTEHPADSKQIEEAYNKFALYKDNFNDSKEFSASFFNDISEFYKLCLNNNQMMDVSVLEEFFGTNRHDYDVVIQDQQILLIYTLKSGYRVIFMYYVPIQQVAGASIEKLSV